MANINLYKIEEDKVQELLKSISGKLDQKDTQVIDRLNASGDKVEFAMTLYVDNTSQTKEVSWNWVAKAFHQEDIRITAQPKGIILIEKDGYTRYAITFGHAFFLIDKFCDRDFGFDFARKLSYKEIKTTALTTPNSHRNKTVNTYIDYSELEFDSGESFAKLKAKVDLPDNFTLYKPSIEIGNSVRFSTEVESLERIVDLIQYVEKVFDTYPDKYNIPVFAKVKDKEKLDYLNERLAIAIREDPKQVNITELDIIGVTEVFNHNDGEFQLGYMGKRKKIPTLSSAEIEIFCKEIGINYKENLLDILVVSFHDGQSVVTKRVRELIDYTDDKEKCMLSRGTWYKYNDDYLKYLRDSINEIEVKYNPDYDFSDAEHDEFINQKYIEEKDTPMYSGKSEETIRKSLKKRYYSERAFNLIREAKDGFQNYDRQDKKVGQYNIEVMDLYKDGMMCAVKIGNTSSKLCYAVDQSLTALKLYKKGGLSGVPQIHTVVLWFVLEKSRHIEDSEGRPQLNKLSLLMLKNRLDQWKKEVRLQGFKPLIYINYRK